MNLMSGSFEKKQLNGFIIQSLLIGTCSCLGKSVGVRQICYEIKANHTQYRQSHNANNKKYSYANQLS